MVEAGISTPNESSRVGGNGQMLVMGKGNECGNNFGTRRALTIPKERAPQSCGIAAQKKVNGEVLGVGVLDAIEWFELQVTIDVNYTISRKTEGGSGGVDDGTICKSVYMCVRVMGRVRCGVELFGMGFYIMHKIQ